MFIAWRCGFFIVFYTSAEDGYVSASFSYFKRASCKNRRETAKAISRLGYLLSLNRLFAY
jgi:hypothetical protein